MNKETKKAALTRRGFVASSAALGAGVLASQAIGSQVGKKPEYKEDYTKTLPGQQSEVKRIDVTYTLCDGCPNQCGIKVFAENGKFWKTLGDEKHPNSLGKQCSRGYGYPEICQSEDRIKAPMKRDASGKFTEITWEEAFSEIGAKLKEVDPTRVFMFQDNRVAKEQYGKRFITALGSPHYWNDAAVSNGTLFAAQFTALGSVFAPDVAHAKCMVYVGKSYGEAFRPDEPQAIVEAKKRGTDIFYVGPKYGGDSSVVDTWVPTKAGTEYAFLLGVAQYLVEHDLYNKEFVEAHSVGFNEFKNSLQSYTPQWVSETCEIDEDFVRQVGDSLGRRAPMAYVDNTWNGTFSSMYENSADTVRLSWLINAMLGSLNEVGGAIAYTGPQVSFAGGKIKDLPKIETLGYGIPYGSDKLPLTGNFGGSIVAAMDGLKDGSCQVLFTQGINAVRDITNSAYAKEALEAVPFKVAIALFEDETTQLADYVLPETSYLERDGVVQTFSGEKPLIAMRKKAIDKVYENTLNFDEIYKGLADAAGIGEYFDFTLDEFNEQGLAASGIAYAELKEAGRVGGFDNGFTPGSFPERVFTESGKIEFASDAFDQAGLAKVPAWHGPKYELADGELRLITGEQALHNHLNTAQSPMLAAVSQSYNLDRAWINTATAQELGIKDGDTIELANDKAQLRAKAYVTSLIEPKAVFVAFHYASEMDIPKGMKDFGIDPSVFREHQFDAATGAGLIGEAGVTVKKVGL
ncbi:MAG: molybdopterin-dependent oxidoreductase [Coriobacteriia bacterium]|nr:molybdopterin-dependent oxidoreductase [Coriobacteriia bacterium]